MDPPTDCCEIDGTVSKLRELQKKAGLTLQQVADAAGTTNQQIGMLERGDRRLTVDWIDRIAPVLGVRPQELLSTAAVPLRGYVGAGSEAHYYGLADDPGEEVPMPPNGNANTVAVEVRGDSLGSLFNRWLVYYDELHDPPTADLLRKLCVVGLADGRVLVKQIRKGSAPGFYHLHSQTEGVIEDVVISWAAEVKAMTPR